MRTFRVVNVVPADHSNETNDDSEPSVAVNPNNVDEMLVSAFTPTEGGNPNGPFFYSSDGGENWQLRFEIPGGTTHDQSPAFARTSGEVYFGIIRGNDGDINVLRSGNPSAGNPLDVIEDRSPADQPWVEATTVSGGSDDGKDRLYVGYNEDGSRSAKLEIWLDARSGSPTFNQITLDPRNPSPNDGYEIRPTVHRDGTVYVAYKSRSSFVGDNSVCDLIVARDDNWGAGSSPFKALKDPGDDKPGRRVATGVPINEGSLGGVRLNNDYNIAVDPSNSSVVYLVWCDNADPSYTLRVRRSVNRGLDWSGDLLVVADAALATMAINSRGRVGLFYQQLVGGQMETHFRSTFDGDNWDDTLVARTATAPSFTGDYGRMVSVGLDFFGVFPAMNSPTPANFFPGGDGTVRYQRNTNGNQLIGLDGTTVVAASVDPFFLKVQERDCVVITDRNTFGKDEIDAMLHIGSPAVIDAAFYVAFDGFRASDLGITAATLTGTPDVAPSISFNPGVGIQVQATACDAEDPDHLNLPQRFTWTYQVMFTDTGDFTQENRDVTLTASMTSNAGLTVTGDAVVTLTTQPNPYEIDGPTSWLSVDLQVFQLQQGGSLRSTPGIALTAGPNDFITRLLANTGGGYNDPARARAPHHPFDTDLVAHEDTSTVTIARTAGFFFPVFNFAVARVRYRALSTPAPNVRAFFRLFQVATTSTEFQPTTTYLTGGTGGNTVPLLGVVNGEVVSIPCFAAPRVDPTNTEGLNAQTDPVNVGPVGEAIPPDGSGAEVQVYFGCWLDINQTTHVLPAGGATGATPYTPTRSVQDSIRGQHQCLVAQIHLDPPAPQIATGASPATSDKLAQRNLTIVGVASPHEVPVTFDIKPTAPRLAAGATPDELMIDWGHVPAGSEASIFLPGTDAAEILRLADRMYLRHRLTMKDANTLTCEARGITFMPIPPGVGSNYAGLLTVSVPDTVRRGRSYKVVARQLRNVSAQRRTPPPPPPQLEFAPRELVLARRRGLIEWRRVVGAFQVTIPVSTRDELRPIEERLLAVLRWIARGIEPQDRWYRVFQRYLSQVAGRVRALGGDPSRILPSPDGAVGNEHPKPPRGERRICATGKIVALLFDRYGDFEGFELDTEDGGKRYSSREKSIAVLAERAWRDRLRVTVCAEADAPHRPESILVHQPPVPFEH